MDLRQKEQQAALKKWKDAGFKGSIIAGTGFGKTKCGIDAACYPVSKNLEHKSIILVPTNALKEQWKEEAKKFDYEEEIKKVEIECFASAYKLTNNHYDTVVVDEIHLCLSDKYIMFFKNNTFNRILGLTATTPENPHHRLRLVNLAKPVYVLSLDKSIELGLVSSYIVYMVPVKFKKGDLLKFKKIQRQFNFYRAKLGYEKAFDQAKLIISNAKNYTQEEIKFALKFLEVVRNRQEMLHNNEAKLDFTKEVVKKLNSDTIIIFNGNNDFSDKVSNLLDSCESWHSGKTDKTRKEILDSYRKGDFNVLSTTKAFNQGMSVSNASIGIINGFNSTTITMIQRIGRLLRSHKDKKNAIIFIPYVKDSQEEKWMEKSLRTMKNCVHIKSLDEVWKQQLKQKTKPLKNLLALA
jgi:superfamily II DNA or RNA helicase